MTSGEHDPAAEARRLRRSADGLRDPGGSFAYEGGIARTHFPTVGIRFDVERIRTERSGDTTGDVSVFVGIHSESVAPMSRITLSGARSRADLARALAARMPVEELWPEMVDFACGEAVRAIRAGAGHLLLRDVSLPTAGAFLLPPFVADRHPTIWFGDGGDGKSYLALAAAASIHTGRAEPFGSEPARAARTAILDFEFSGEDHRERLDRLLGTGQLPDILYVPCSAPLRDDVDRIRRIVAETRTEFLVVDSVGFACHDAPEKSESALAFFQALRMIGLPSLLIAHVTKDRTGDDKPFGSAFWHNGARLTWYLERSEDGRQDELRVGFFNRKANLATRVPYGIGVELHFGHDRTQVRRFEVAEDESLAVRLPVRARITASLRDGAKTYVQLAKATGASVDTVQKTIRRMAKRGTVVSVPGDDGILRHGLAA